MRLAEIMENDIVDCDNGFCVSVWYFGCPHKCKGCHNSQLWSEDCLEESDREDVLNRLIKLINKNGINRCLSFLGGEPLYDKNLEDTIYLSRKIKEIYPDIKIYCWTGYIFEEFTNQQKEVLKYVYKLIDGPFILEKRDTTLKLRGSSNQRILYKGTDF